MLHLEEIRRCFEETYEVIAFDIMQDDEIVGGVEMSNEEGNTPYCAMIEVEEEYRNNGIGTFALQELTSMFGEFDLAPDNEDARRLYERLGEQVYDGDNDCADQGYGIYRIW